MDFAAFELQRNVVVCDDTRKFLRDVAHFDDVIALRLFSGIAKNLGLYGVRNFVCLLGCLADIFNFGYRIILND